MFKKDAMKEGEFAKYKGKEFAASVYHGVATLFSVDLLDIERYWKDFHRKRCSWERNEDNRP